MDKSNVIIYAEGLAKEKGLSDKQKEELITALNEATSVLNGNQKRIEEALTFLDNKIQNSYRQFFTDSGIVATEIKSTTMIKVEEIIKEVEQSKINQEKTEAQTENYNEMLNSNSDKEMNKEIKESRLFDFPEDEVITNIVRSLSSYFGKDEFSEEFLEKLSKDIYDAKKIDLEIEERVEAGEKREDVEAEIFPDEESRLKHDADVIIYDETAEEEYTQIVEEICAIAAKYGITLEEAEAKFFEGKPESEHLKFKIEQEKDRARIRDIKRNLEEDENTKESKGTESDKSQSYTLGRFEKRKYDRYQEYIEQQQQKLKYLEKQLERVKMSGSKSDVVVLEDEYQNCRSNIESYQKMIDRMIENAEKRETRRKDEVRSYLRNKGIIDEYVKKGLTVEAATGRTFKHDYISFYKYLIIDRALQSDAVRAQKRGNQQPLKKIGNLGKKSNDITGENIDQTENGRQTRGKSQLVLEEIATEGENKKNKPFKLFKGLFKKRRTIQAGIKGAYDDLATAQTTFRTKKSDQEQQTSHAQDIQTTIRNDDQQPRHEDKGNSNEQVL